MVIYWWVVNIISKLFFEKKEKAFLIKINKNIGVHYYKTIFYVRQYRLSKFVILQTLTIYFLLFITYVTIYRRHKS